MAALPRTRYAKSDGLNIAYQTSGTGPRNLVLVPGFVTHLDLAWENPALAGLARRCSTFSRVICFDKRNTGLSGRTATAPTLEERMDDIRAVMDDAEVASAAIVGISEGGPMAVLFAATYPERVEALVLGATYARLTPPPGLEERLAFLEENWGTGAPLQFFLAGSDPDWAATYERSAATPRAAVEILRLNVEIDVRAALPAVSAPTLVLHRSGDPVVPVAAGRELADGIAGARFVELPATPTRRSPRRRGTRSSTSSRSSSRARAARWSPTASWRPCSSRTSSGPRNERLRSVIERGALASS